VGNKKTLPTLPGYLAIRPLAHIPFLKGVGNKKTLPTLPGWWATKTRCPPYNSMPLSFVGKSFCGAKTFADEGKSIDVGWIKR